MLYRVLENPQRFRFAQAMYFVNTTELTECRQLRTHRNIERDRLEYTRQWPDASQHP